MPASTGKLNRRNEPPPSRMSPRCRLMTWLCSLGITFALFIVTPLLRSPAPAPESVRTRYASMEALPEPEPEPAEAIAEPDSAGAVPPAPPELPLIPRQPAPAAALPDLAGPAIPGEADLPWPEPAVPAAEKVLAMTRVDRRPRPIVAPAPVYPATARTRRIEGWVDTAFTVRTDGRAVDVVIIEAEPAGVFEQSVRTALAGARFAPGRQGNRDVPVRVRQRFRFNLQP